MIRTKTTIICDRCKGQIEAEWRGESPPKPEELSKWVNLAVYHPAPLKEFHFCPSCWPFVKTVPQSLGSFTWEK